MYKAASIAAADASSRAQSYLPAHVIAVKCALKNNDKKWALQATKQAIDAAINPPPLLYKELVKLKTEGEKLATDTEMVQALSNLRRTDKNNIIWAEMLGFIRFQRGDWEVMDALQEMTFAIRNGSKSKLAYIIAAESSRLINNYEQAIYLLRQGLKIYPNDITILNNLAYALAQTKNGMTEALEIIETLTQNVPDNTQILDTATVIYIKNNQLKKAKSIIADIYTKTAKNSEIYFRAKTHEADIAIREKELTRAKEILESIIATAEDIPKLDLIQASDLLNKVRTMQYREKQAKKKKKNSLQSTSRSK
jgi:tetratricopeptide (TPR) repeat protein